MSVGPGMQRQDAESQIHNIPESRILILSEHQKSSIVAEAMTDYSFHHNFIPQTAVSRFYKNLCLICRMIYVCIRFHLGSDRRIMIDIMV